jgi:glycosyltransferase involved in cell wall biosynthesis
MVHDENRRNNNNTGKRMRPSTKQHRVPTVTNKKLLWLSDSPFLPTGYATISLNITKRLAEDHGWDIVYLTHQWIGREVEKGDIKGMPFKIYGKGRAEFCQDVIQQVIRKEKPAVFVTLLDTFMVFPWYLEQDYAPARTVFYYPIDGGGTGLPYQCDNVLRRCSLPVSMSRYGQDLVKKKYGINAAFIPHAVDSSHYKRLPAAEIEALRREKGLLGKYVVGVVARNQGRKHLDATIKVFAKFCADKPEARLLLHMDPQDPAAPYDLPALVREYGIENKVIWTGTNFYSGVPYDKMPGIYNLMDVFLLTTSGEGWGVPTTEAMSCEVPVVITDYTTTQEMVVEKQAGLPIKLAAEITGTWLVDRGIIDINHGVEQMNVLYHDAALRARLGANGREGVLKEYDWKNVVGQWDELLESMLRW